MDSRLIPFTFVARLLAVLFLLATLLTACSKASTGQQTGQAEAQPSAVSGAPSERQAGQVQPRESPTRTAGQTEQQNKGPVNRIAYVGTDNQVYTVNPDGSGRRQLTRDGIYIWPTWSPDAQSLVFSGITRARSGRAEIGLYMLPSLGGEYRALHINDANVPAAIGPNILHYMVWSPDGQMIAFIAQTFELRLTLFVDNPYDLWNPTQVTGRAPLYLSWSPDSSHLVVHRGQDLLLVDVKKDAELRDLRARSEAFRAPAWSPTGDGMVFAGLDSSGKNVLYLADNLGENRIPLGNLQASAAFLWSPSGQYIAVAGTRTPEDFTYKELVLLNKDGSLEKVLTKNELLSFFWSPDGTKIVYATPPDKDDSMEWVLIDVQKGTETRLVKFIPSDDLLVMMAFFDQYAYSNSIWSPDSKSLVFAGDVVEATTREAASSQGGSRIYVLGVGKPGQPQAIAEGTMAFWSPK